MPGESIDEFGSRLQTTLGKIADFEADMGSLEIGGQAVDLSRRLLQAYCGLAHALKQHIAFKIEETARRESAQIENEHYEASAEFSLSEHRLRNFAEGSFTQLWDRREAAREQWESALRRLCRHRSAHSKPLASCSRSGA